MKTFVNTMFAAALLSTTAMTASALADNHAKVKVEIEANRPFFDDKAPLAEKSDKTFVTPRASQILAGNIMGKYIYNGMGDDAETIGDVNDLLMDENGETVAAIIGVGGFLGIGEKNVAVSFGKLMLYKMPSGEERLVAQLTKEDLEGAEQFDREIVVPRITAVNDAREATNNNNPSPEAPFARKASAGVMDVKPVIKSPASDAKNADASAQPSTEEVAKADESASDTKSVAVMLEKQMLDANELIGARVYSSANADIGEISNLLIDDNDNVVAAVIDVGGFLGIGEKPVAVSLSAVQMSSKTSITGAKTVMVNFTQEQLENHASYTEEGYKADPNSMIMSYNAAK